MYKVIDPAISESRERIASIVQRTPVLTSGSFNRAAGVRVFVKCENLQKGGSFKIRGAANFILSLSPADRSRGVIAYSSGNDPQAVAITAQHPAGRYESWRCIRWYCG